MFFANQIIYHIEFWSNLGHFFITKLRCSFEGGAQRHFLRHKKPYSQGGWTAFWKPKVEHCEVELFLEYKVGQPFECLCSWSKVQKVKVGQDEIRHLSGRPKLNCLTSQWSGTKISACSVHFFEDSIFNYRFNPPVDWTNQLWVSKKKCPTSQCPTLTFRNVVQLQRY